MQVRKFTELLGDSGQLARWGLGKSCPLARPFASLQFSTSLVTLIKCKDLSLHVYLQQLLQTLVSSH